MESFNIKSVEKYKIYFLAVVPLCIYADTSLEFLCLLLNLACCYKTYICLIEGLDNKQWCLYWILYGIIKQVEFLLLGTIQIIFLGYYFYFKIVFFALLLSNQKYVDSLTIKFFQFAERFNLSNRLKDFEENLMMTVKSFKSTTKANFLERKGSMETGDIKRNRKESRD